MDKDGDQMCKLMVQNKRLTCQNESLKQQLFESQNATKKAEDDLLNKRVQSKHKLSYILDKSQ